jgi:hypothetical protein
MRLRTSIGHPSDTHFALPSGVVPAPFPSRLQSFASPWFLTRHRFRDFGTRTPHVEIEIVYGSGHRTRVYSLITCVPAANLAKIVAIVAASRRSSVRARSRVLIARSGIRYASLTTSTRKSLSHAGQWRPILHYASELELSDSNA